MQMCLIDHMLSQPLVLFFGEVPDGVQVHPCALMLHGPWLRAVFLFVCELLDGVPTFKTKDQDGYKDSEKVI